jgi:hypothetical protein
MAQLVAEYESSGLNASAFCRQKGMNRLTLETYRLRQGKASGTRHRSRKEADRLAAEYEASGLNRVEFCQLKKLPVNILGRYLKRYRRQQSEIEEAQRTGQQQVAVERASGKRWLAVEVCGATAVEADGGASGLSVVVSGGCRIEIGRGFDVETLKRLLDVVERD